MKQKIKYFLNCAGKTLRRIGRACPSCGCSQSKVIDSKYIVTKLHRCNQCKLLYRTPTTTVEENASFYQEEYTQEITTEMPNKEQLSAYMDSSFSDTEKDFSTYISVLEAIGAKRGDSLFDFGCSWGYGSWQLMKYGLDVESLEISSLRADYAREKLGIKVHNSISEVSRSFDIFFSSHVLEHVPSVKEVIDFGLNILKPGGLFVAFTPNGSTNHRRKNPEGWYKLWGLVHPNFLDDVYYEYNFSENPFVISSNEYDMRELTKWRDNQNAQTKLDLEGRELLVVARK